MKRGTWLTGAMLLGTLVAGPLQGQECRRGAAPGTVLRGSVVDRETRVPLQGAEVRLSWVAGNGRERTIATETDAQGRFRMCRIVADELVDVRADFWGDGPLRRVSVARNDSLEVTLEAESPYSALRGRVQDEGGAALGSAEVQLLGTPLRTVTDASGSFAIPKLPPGRYVVQIEHLGHGTRTDSIDVAFRSTVELVAKLATEPLRLAPLTVSVRSHVLADAGFYERRTAGFGAFRTRTEWELEQPLVPSDLLRMVPGIRVVPGVSSIDNVIVDRANCPVRYYMDGARLNASFQIDQIDVQWIEAVEVYRGPSEVPAQFRSSASSERGNCGVIVIWTRRTLR